MTKKEKAKIILQELDKLYPDPKIELRHSNTLELLIAVILSAQSTDKKINEITEKLFKKYKTLDDYVNADLEEFQEDIRSSGFYKNKAKNILKTVKMIKENFGGKIPNNMKDLISLAGVARKTANVIMSHAYNDPQGIVVDTHVKRLSNKFGLTKESDPVKIEKDLMEVIPEDKWRDFSFQFVLYGRYVSTARQKNDDDDPISQALAVKKST